MRKTGEQKTASFPLLILLLAAVGGVACVIGSIFGGPDGKREPWFGITVLAVVVAIGVAGYLSLSWLGVLLFYGTALAVAAALFLVGCYTYMFVGKRRLTRSLDRLAGLSVEELLAVMVDPSDADFRLAAVELMKRGVKARPAKERLLDLLASNVQRERARGLLLLRQYYNELQLPEEWSSMDSTDVWRERIQSLEHGTA
jgi:hypothetical protein